LSNAMTMSMNDKGEPLARRALKVALVLLLHAVALVWMSRHQIRAMQEQELLRMDVRMVNELLPPPPPEKPKPLPARLQPAPQVAMSPPPPPVMTAAPGTAAAPASFSVPPQPPQPPGPPREVPTDAVSATSAPPRAAAGAPEPLTVTAARFDADYLNNPPPTYPAQSRRMREEGQVLLLVHVSADGAATAVHVRQSSGFSRLDDAALAAVRQWRFVPARRGHQTMASTVLVPIVFTLKST